MFSILFTNITFSERTGTEVATLELAQAMRARGHCVAVYSPTLGQTAIEARKIGIPVTSRIETIGFIPDIIHGNHNVALAIAMVRFPVTPALFVCHDTASRYDEAILAGRIEVYVAVDAACRDRLVVDGVDEARIVVMPNGVDLAEYSLRASWPDRAGSALLIVKQRTDHVNLVAEACRLAGIPLEIVGPGVGNVVTDLARRCRNADIVFAHSRSAIEAAAVGAAVIIIDEFGFGGPFHQDQVTLWPETPLSRRILAPLPSARELATMIQAYDPVATQAVTRMLRARVDLAVVAEEWEGLYERARNAAKTRTGADQGALAGFLSRFMPQVSHLTGADEAREQFRVQEDGVQRLVDMLQRLSDGWLSSVAFHPTAFGNVLLGPGWHHAEEFGIWSASEKACLWLPEALLAQWGFEFLVACSHYMPEHTPRHDVRTVRVSIGTCRVATWTFTPGSPDGPAQKFVCVPPELRPRRGHSVLLNFHIDRPVAPVEAGENADRRRLGIRLSALEAVKGPGSAR